MLGILDYFTIETPAWTVDALQIEMGGSRATTYRYVKALVDAGLLAPAAGGAYVLGARIIELDRQIRLCDPLLAAARDVMVRVCEALQANLMLCGFYGENVMCVHQEWIDAKVQSSYERGRPMPLFRGATARVILAHLPTYQQKNLLLTYGKEIAESGLGENWDEFRGNLKTLRREGSCVSFGQIDNTLVGIGAPIFLGQGDVTGSLSFIVSRGGLKEARIEELRAAVKAAAAEISERLDLVMSVANGGNQASRSPRRLAAGTR
jgi:DNA-binding IclR family transcriptional regulator